MDGSTTVDMMLVERRQRTSFLRCCEPAEARPFTRATIQASIEFVGGIFESKSARLLATDACSLLRHPPFA